MIREHAIEMGHAQNDAWGLGYIDLYLIHFPVAQTYIPPSELRYPVRISYCNSVPLAKFPAGMVDRC